MMGIQLRTSHMIGKNFTTELDPNPLLINIFMTKNSNAANGIKAAYQQKWG